MKKKMSLIMFSNEYDKALAALILANSAKEMDMDVTMYFAFWGLTLLKEPGNEVSSEASAYQKLLSLFTPASINDMPLSHLNMLGLGKEMLEKLMKENSTPSLKDFLKGARKKGVRFYGCQLSMKVMGITKDDLIPELEVATAYDYIKEATDSDIQLFI